MALKFADLQKKIGGGEIFNLGANCSGNESQPCSVIIDNHLLL